ncbi:MAG: sulfite exporter TauE/SafE family protein [Pseudonocardiaceae bacterium]
MGLVPAVDLAVLIVAGLVSGMVNALAGGGSLLLFPALLAVGLPPLAANVTNSIVQCAGSAGLALGSRRELRGQRSRVLSTAGVAVAGSLAGSLLLLMLPSQVFDAVVPALVALASVLLGVQPWLSRWIGEPEPDSPDRRAVLLPAVFLGAIYGGYFGGALGVILIAVLALTAQDDLRRLNAVKGVLSLIISAVSMMVFAIGAPVNWLVVALVSPVNLIGGFLGAKLAGRVAAPVLRAGVVVVGLAVSIYLFTSHLVSA